MKIKNIFFIVTLFILTIISSTLFTVPVSILSVDKNSEFVKVVAEQKDCLFLKNITSQNNYDQPISQDQVNHIKQIVDSKVLNCYSLYSIDGLGISPQSLNLDVENIDNIAYYYLPVKNMYKYSRVVEIDSIDDLPHNNISGDVPHNNDEILITSLLADYIIKFGKDSSLTSYDSLVQAPYYIQVSDAKKVKVCGIMKMPLSEFEDLKKLKPSEESVVGENNYSSLLDENNPSLYEKFLEKIYGYEFMYAQKGFLSQLNVNDGVEISDFHFGPSTSSPNYKILSMLYVVHPSSNDVQKILHAYPILNDGLHIQNPLSEEFIDTVHTLNRLSRISIKISLVLFIITIIWEIIIIWKKYLSIRLSFKLAIFESLLTLCVSFLSIGFLKKYLTYISQDYSYPLNLTVTSMLCGVIFVLLICILSSMICKTLKSLKENKNT